MRIKPKDILSQGLSEDGSMLVFITKGSSARRYRRYLVPKSEASVWLSRQEFYLQGEYDEEGEGA